MNERDDEQQGELVDAEGVAADASGEAGATEDAGATEHAQAAQDAGGGDASWSDAGAAVELDLQALSREELENELELARAEIERLQEQSLRRQAELINFRTFANNFCPSRRTNTMVCSKSRRPTVNF